MLGRHRKEASLCEERDGRIVFHIDMDAFFASVEVMCRPKLRGKPVIVCGKPTTRSVAAAASYEAREYGIRSGMSTVECFRRCPHVVAVEGNPGQYIYVSLELLRIYKEFSTIVEPYSIDEAFVEMTGTRCTWKNCEGVALEIKDRIGRRFPGLTASIGVGPNKLVAKMCGSMEKPDGVTVIRPGGFTEVFGDRPVTDIWGVGDKTSLALSMMGVDTIEELARHPVSMLRRRFGIMGEILHMMGAGRDDTPVTPYYEGMPVKSMGHEHTLPADTWDIAEAEKVLLRLCDQVARRMRKKGYLGNVISMRLRFSDFDSVGRQKKIDFYTDEERTIYKVARELMHRHWRPGHSIRLVGVNCSGLVKVPEAVQVDLFRQKEEVSHRKLLAAVDAIKDKFGESAITRARLVSLNRRMWDAGRRVSEPRFQKMSLGSTERQYHSIMAGFHDNKANVDTRPLPPGLSSSPFDMLRHQDVEDKARR
ncbi:MAG: DNA polymerase IV [Candidatus Eisenbacteria bacterium]|nr:DNA polymerase IV [Candidatus Eisenbacteria bacterium]